MACERCVAMDMTCEECLAVVDAWLARFQEWGKEHGLAEASRRAIMKLGMDDSLDDEMRSHLVCATRDCMLEWDALRALD